MSVWFFSLSVVAVFAAMFVHARVVARVMRSIDVGGPNGGVGTLLAIVVGFAIPLSAALHVSTAWLAEDLFVGQSFGGLMAWFGVFVAGLALRRADARHSGNDRHSFGIAVLGQLLAHCGWMCARLLSHDGAVFAFVLAVAALLLVTAKLGAWVRARRFERLASE